MVGILLVAGVALLFSGMGKAEPSASSEDDSTEPANALKRTKPGLFGLGDRRAPAPIPPKNSRQIGVDRVADLRYDFKGGLPSLAIEKVTGGEATKPRFGAFDPPTKVAPSRPVAVMPPPKPATALPSRFRVPLMASSLAVKVPTVRGR